MAAIPDRPISFEVFADDFDDMIAQGRVIASWGDNVNVKIPVTTTKGAFTGPVVRTLANAGVVVNVTAVMTAEQVERVAECLAPNVPAIVSVFAGRVADTGRDPVPIMRASLRALAARPKAELLWASPRELLNIFQADEIGCHIITVSHDVLAKLSLIGKDLDEYSLETVKMFHRDATAAGFKIAVPAAQSGVLTTGCRRHKFAFTLEEEMPNKFSQVFVTGGAGYVGSVLIPQLLERGYTVTSYDISYYGDNFLPKSNPNLKVIRGDIRDTAKLAKAIAGHDAFISLACISNDASFELDEKLSTSVNLDAFEPMVLAAKKAGVRASSTRRRARSTASPTSRT